MPDMGAYWLCPACSDAIDASMSAWGGSSSGKPCPRLIASIAAARWLMVVKIVVPNGARRVVVPWVTELEPTGPEGVFVLDCAGRWLI